MLSKEDFLKRNRVFIDADYNRTSVLGTPSEIWTKEEFEQAAYNFYTGLKPSIREQYKLSN